ncbi:hypothetical protein A2311_01040 [candidate division WOR-1 bacterium RIFOXYB2_FULL_48_7]|uniref:Permease n=1 Tax=candidate division WOR-1 bacterium RIFOXYB2_FULL_48_7 TaxID=1802583 RepID=A0A1F4TNV2_UNCSA|nr:MAG: hypothetical protein A2311_01040 [candidate division WOR-1 bacterium RIFOXYB2_FULL_48_7]
MLQQLADFITFRLLNLQPGSHLAESVNFFFYDVPKIYLLLLIIVYLVSIIRTFLGQRRIRQILSHKKVFIGNILAAGLGIFTPFCTCSAIPLFIGMLEAGVPLGVTMSFLVASPMINEVALVLLWGLFGWQVAVIYVASGLLVAVVAGLLIGYWKMEQYVEPIVGRSNNNLANNEQKYSWPDRLSYATEYTRGIFSQIWWIILVGVGLGAFIHGYVPIGFMTTYAGKDNPLAVLLAVLIGVPLYSNAAGTIPVVQALMAKGLPLGTSLAFMMAVTALSLPEFIILRRILKLPLLLAFFGTVALGIVLIGYLFNYLFI